MGKIETKMEESQNRKNEANIIIISARGQRRESAEKKIIEFESGSCHSHLRVSSLMQGQGRAEWSLRGAERVLHFALIGRILKGEDEDEDLGVQWNYKSCSDGAERH